MALSVIRHDDVTELRMTSVGSRAVGMGVSAYVIRGTLIDTGFHHARAELLAAARSLGVNRVIVTHWHEDHAGNVAALAAAGLPLHLRSDTESILRRRPTIPLYRRVVWGNPPAVGAITQFADHDLETIHAPGHSTDHQVVWDPQTATLFSGDLWLGVRARILHAAEDPYQIIESLRRIRQLAPARMFDAHRGMVANPVESIDAKIAWLGETLEAIEREIRAGATDRDIVKRVLGGEDRAAIVSRGDYSIRNLVKAVRLSSRSRGA